MLDGTRRNQSDAGKSEHGFSVGVFIREIDDVVDDGRRLADVFIGLSWALFCKDLI